MTTKNTAPRYYVSTNTDNHVRLAFWPAEVEMHIAVTLTESETRRLAAALLAKADELPRVASAADLGLVA
jgi:hypothetical protein